MSHDRLYIPSGQVMSSWGGVFVDTFHKPGDQLVTANGNGILMVL